MVFFLRYKWAFGLCAAPWSIADAVEEGMDLAKALDVYFVHVKMSANSAAELLAKEFLI